MNKKIKTLLCMVAVACTAAFSSLAVGCDTFEQFICEHEYGAVSVIEAPTCSKKGKGEKTCTLCEKVETVDVDCLEHNLVKVERVEPTCTKAGTEEYTKCRDCGFTEKGAVAIAPTGHTVVKDEAVKATCLESGLTEGEHCSVCDEVLLEQTEVKATGHIVVKVPEQESTCTEAGHTAGEICKNCESVYSGYEEIPATGHEYGENGKCADCGAAETDEA